MKMPPPPARRMPPPPPPRRSKASVAGGGHGALHIKVNPCMSKMTLTEAVFVIGDYPQVPWEEAVENLKRRISENGWNEINPMTLWLADRKRSLELLNADRNENAK